MINYDKKLYYLYRHQRCRCPICGLGMSFNENLDLHHKCRNHKWRKKKFPLFLNSILNLDLVHHSCHLQKDGDHIGDMEAERIEIFLNRHSKISSFINNPNLTFI